MQSQPHPLPSSDEPAGGILPRAALPPPRRSFVSIITVLSFLGVALGVAVLIVVLSVMTGFREQFQNKIIGFDAHITVSSPDVIYDSDRIVDLIQKQPGVLAAEGVVRGPVLVEFNHSLSPAYISSASLDGDDPVLPLKKFLKMGDYELRGDSVLVGREWSRRNAAFPGDQITILGGAAPIAPLRRSTRRTRSNKQPVVQVMPDTPVIRGVFETGRITNSTPISCSSRFAPWRSTSTGSATACRNHRRAREGHRPGRRHPRPAEQDPARTAHRRKRGWTATSTSSPRSPPSAW